MEQRYEDKKLKPATLALIDKSNVVLADYAGQGFILTLRQLFYQLVTANTIPNTEESYNLLGNAISAGRMNGLIDWDMIEDRTRNLQHLAFWDKPQSILKTCAKAFRLDLWQGQEYRIEVWVEKEALIGIVEHICQPMRIDYIACRGYMSQSEMRVAGQRFLKYYDDGQTPVVLHLGDHDPSGQDMSRDIRDRLFIFCEGRDVEFERLALNMDQIKKYRPPPNPAKMSDSRSDKYVAKYGKHSWEVDALKPNVLTQLVHDAVDQYWDKPMWDQRLALEDKHKEQLGRAAQHWDKITQFKVMK